MNIYQRFAVAAIVSFSLLILSACGGGGGSTGGASLPQPLSARFPMDGRVDLTAFAQVYQKDITLLDGIGSGSLVRTTNLSWAMTNDDRDLYIAMEWDDPDWNHGLDIVAGPTDFDGIKLLIDEEGDGTVAAGEDERTLIAASISSNYVDQHHVVSGDETDLIGDGYGQLRYDAVRKVYQAEFLIPLSDDSHGEDADLSAASRYNFIIFDHVQLAGMTGNAGTTYSGQTDSTAWPSLPLVVAGQHQHPQLPTTLGGLIVFLSDHEVANREVYTFDPQTGITTRVTNAPGLFKDGVSLSHDRSRVAFFGAASETDYTGYEIYAVNIDGSNLQQLTSNTLLDGHPAWSPDDSQIAFASFRDGGARASIVVMDADGTNVGPDLTPAPYDDNDPEFLPDGRIVFKTNRFQAQPQVQMAVMNADGSGVKQLTFQSGVSDHDAVGDASHIIFERFTKGTNYATDQESGFSPWDIVEARLDGSGERTVLHDSYVNWLPLYDPSGLYIAFQKSGGYTDVRLMTSQGEDLGRLIPDMTHVHYLDWK